MDWGSQANPVAFCSAFERALCMGCTAPMYRAARPAAASAAFFSHFGTSVRNDFQVMDIVILRRLAVPSQLSPFVIPRSKATRNLLFARVEGKQISHCIRNDNI